MLTGRLPEKLTGREAWSGRQVAESPHPSGTEWAAEVSLQIQLVYPPALNSPRNLTMPTFPFALRGSLVVALLGFASAASGQELFPDKALEAVVRTQVFEKRNNTQPLTEADVQNIAILNGKGKKIANLAGLEKCRSLAQLELDNNEISDLAPIKELKNIQLLSLKANKISSLAPLADLVNIQYLDITANQVADIGPLKTVAALRNLYASGNQIKDISPLAACKRVYSLYLDGNPIADFKPLAELKDLERLDLHNTGISDLSPLAGLTEWRYLFLTKNKITNLSVLTAMAKKDFEGEKRFAPFWKVYLGDNPLSDSAKTAQVAELQKYNVRVNLESRNW